MRHRIARALCENDSSRDVEGDRQGDRRGLHHCGACALRALRSSHSCAAEKRVSPGTVAARLIDFHFGSKPGACSLSIRENRWSTKRAARPKRFELTGQLKATSAVGTAIVATRSPCLIRPG